MTDSANNHDSDRPTATVGGPAGTQAAPPMPPGPDELIPSPERRRQAIEIAAAVLLVVVFMGVSLATELRKPSADLGRAFGTILAAGLTLIMYSFLYRDNALFKIAENLFVGVALGYSAIMAWRGSLRPEVYEPIFNAPTIGALEAALLQRGVPILLGVLLLTRLSKKYTWLSRYSYALIIGWGAGVAIPLMTHSYILKQLHSGVAPLQDAVSPAGGQWLTGAALPIVGEALIMIGTVAVLYYFFFSVEQRRAGKAISRLGVLFLMVSFGAAFGYTVMGRVSLLIGRVHFLLFEWLKIGQ